MPSHGLRGRLRRCAPRRLRPLHQAGRVQLRLRPAVAPAKLCRALQLLVEMLHVPAPIDASGTAPASSRSRRPRRASPTPCPSRRSSRPVQPFLLVAVPVAAKLPLRHPKSSPASITDSSRRSHRLKTSRNFCILRSCSHVVRFIDPPPAEAQNRTTRVLPNPDMLCACEVPVPPSAPTPGDQQVPSLYVTELSSSISPGERPMNIGRRAVLRFLQGVLSSDGDPSDPACSHHFCFLASC